MHRLFRSALLSTSVFGASWVGAVSYWRATNRMPSTLDLLTWMAVLPLALLLAFWIGRRVVLARAAAASATGTAPAADAVPAAPSAPPAVPALAMLASSIRTPHGATPAELAQAIGAQRARAGLDPELVDDNGFPLLSARADVAVDEIKAEVDAWRSGAALGDPHWSPEQWRALALGSAVAADLLLAAAGHPQLLAEDDGAPTVAPLLRIHAAMTPEWNEEQRAVAGAWLAALAVRYGWPAQRLQVDSLPAPAPTVLGQLAAHAAGGAEPVFAIVLAFGSRIGEAQVERMAMDGTLFSAANPQGLVPGEAAAGLLVADGVQAALFDPAAPRLQLAGAPRNAQGAGARPDTALLRQLAGVLLPDAQAAAGVSAIFADTGHRSAPQVELMRFAGEALPHLDAGEDLKAVGAACGHCGDAPFLAALALAHQHACDSAGAALCVGNEDPLQRTAALVSPAAAHS